MTKKRNSSRAKKDLRPKKLHPSLHPAPPHRRDSAPNGNSHLSPDSDAGKLSKLHPEDVRLVEVVEKIPHTVRVVSPAGIVVRISDEDRRRLERLRDGTHRAADRVLVTEQFNGTEYRHLSQREWSMQIVYFEGDQVAEAQFLKLLNKLM